MSGKLPLHIRVIPEENSMRYLFLPSQVWERTSWTLRHDPFNLVFYILIICGTFMIGCVTATFLWSRLHSAKFLGCLTFYFVFAVFFVGLHLALAAWSDVLWRIG